uniref:Uncharacterized protein LOC101493015 n=1 Tax=Cicer arietinum TaxID=3827 RepID=A0A1S2YLC0_CICAR|nr:uncharacterized protein LOC101493015 [Cicer arietinum]
MPPSAKPPTQPEPSINTPIKTTPLATTPPQHPSSTSAQAPTTTKPTTPSKSTFSYEPSQLTPPHKKRRLINEIVSPLTKQNEPSSQSKPQTKPMKTKSAMTIAQFLARKKLPNPQRRKTFSSSTSTSSASEPSPPSKKPNQTTPPLISPDKSKLFNEKWAQRLVGIGRVFVFDNLVVDGNAVQHHTDALGWTSFLKISESYYPDVVCAFYCNAKTFADKSLIISTIKGMEIKLTPEILASILQLPTKGPSVFGDHWYSALNLRKTKVLSDLFEEDSTRYLSTYLKPLPKVFNNMCQHTLIPHYGSHEYVSDNDALLIHHLLNCKRLNLPYVILQHMICAATKDYRKNIVPYGMVMTKVFKYFGVSLASETSMIKISKFSTKNLSHMRKTSSTQMPTPPSSFPTSFKRKRSAGRRPTTNLVPFSTHPTDPEENTAKIPIPEHSSPNPEPTVGPSNTSIGLLSSVSSSFASFPSISTTPIPSNTVVATTSQPSTHLHSSPPLTEPSNSDIMATFQIILARRVQHDQEIALLRTWLTDHLAPKMGISPPPPHPIHSPSQVPHPGKSSSSEGSSPSLAS